MARIDVPVHVHIDDEQARAVILTQRSEIQRLREAIADALADMQPGYAPYETLSRAIAAEPGT